LPAKYGIGCGGSDRRLSLPVEELRAKKIQAMKNAVEQEGCDTVKHLMKLANMNPKPTNGISTAK
jgi:hypothetical protein